MIRMKTKQNQEMVSFGDSVLKIDTEKKEYSDDPQVFQVAEVKGDELGYDDATLINISAGGGFVHGLLDGSVKRNQANTEATISILVVDPKLVLEG